MRLRTRVGALIGRAMERILDRLAQPQGLDQWGNDEGDLKPMSFGFKPVRDDWGNGAAVLKPPPIPPEWEPPSAALVEINVQHFIETAHPLSPAEAETLRDYWEGNLSMPGANLANRVKAEVMRQAEFLDRVKANLAPHVPPCYCAWCKPGLQDEPPLDEAGRP